MSSSILSRARATGVNLALALVALALGLGLAEIFLRTLSEARLGFRYEDGMFGMAREYERDPRRNANGFHDREHGPKAPGVRRIVLLGDSFVEGYSVPLEETVGYRLEHHLNGLGEAAYEVVSIAKSGWSQRQQLPALQELGERLDPDVVVTLFFSFNDVSGNSLRLSRRLLQQFRETGGYFRVRPGWCRYRADEVPLLMIEGSKLNQVLSYRLAVALRDRGPGSIPLDYIVYSTEPSEAWRQAWRHTEALFRATRDEVLAAGGRYAVVAASTPHGIWGAEKGVKLLEKVYPALEDVNLDLDGPDRRLEEICRAEGIPFLALEPLFRIEQGNGAVLHWPYDGHWNASGNDLAGRLMADFILELERRDGHRG